MYTSGASSTRRRRAQVNGLHVEGYGIPARCDFVPKVGIAGPIGRWKLIGTTIV
jgi:hypothetical protein